MSKRVVNSSVPRGGAEEPAKTAMSNGFHGKADAPRREGLLKSFINRTVVPLLLMTLVPNAVFVIWYTVMHCEGSYMKMLSTFQGRSFLEGLAYIWTLVKYPSAPIILIFIGYCCYALIMMKLLPGKTVYGPVTPKGNTPEYSDNGFKYFTVTISLFWVLTIALRPCGYSPSIIYDRFDEVIYLLNIFSLGFCALLYLKGRFAPSSNDSGSSGNIIFDYYWGMELYPRVFGWDVKVFTNCRFGMMSWALLACVHAVKSYELYGFVDSMFVSVALQLIYITKFFWWEAGYMRTIDIMVDRAGFYICWGCLVFVPSFYPAVSYYMVGHPVKLGLAVTALFLTLGTLSIFINFAADDQKQKVRDAGGKCLIWGQQPDMIYAKYRLEGGEERQSILLCSGWWGIARHFHYIPEILLAFFWTVPALCENLLPYCYVIYLTILLTHRTYRDDTKCGDKYGPSWKKYCEKVPYKMIPYIF